MNIVEFYLSLVNHDWNSSWSEDPQEYWAGEVSYESLHEHAVHNGPSFAWVMVEYKKRLFSGKPWGTDARPLLVAPLQPSLDTMIDLRADFERLAFTSEGASEDLVLERARYMGALAHDISEIPGLIGSVAALREAWERGQQEAIELHKTLRPAGLMKNILKSQKASQSRADATALERDQEWWC